MYQVTIALSWNYEIFVNKNQPKAPAVGQAVIPVFFKTKALADACAKFVKALPQVKSVDVDKIKANKDIKDAAYTDFRPRGLKARIDGITNPAPFIKSVYPSANEAQV